MKFFFILLMINLYGLTKYMVDYSIKNVSYQKQMTTDFFCPLGSLLGRLIFKFKLKENPSGYIFGIFLEIFLTAIYFIMI